jgi:hypothetical protein
MYFSKRLSTLFTYGKALTKGRAKSMKDVEKLNEWPSSKESAGCEIERQVVYIDERTLSEVMSFVSGCSRCACTPELTLDYVLDTLTGNGPATVYVLPGLAACSRCGHEIDRATFIRVD